MYTYVGRDYVSTIFAVEFSDVVYAFFASDKIEPYVILCAISSQQGRLHVGYSFLRVTLYLSTGSSHDYVLRPQRLTLAQVANLVTAVAAFRAKFVLVDELYHYTSLSERAQTDRFVASGGASGRAKAHSSHFHLKIRIPTQMLVCPNSVSVANISLHCLLY